MNLDTYQTDRNYTQWTSKQRKHKWEIACFYFQRISKSSRRIYQIGQDATRIIMTNSKGTGLTTIDRRRCFGQPIRRWCDSRDWGDYLPSAQDSEAFTSRFFFFFFDWWSWRGEALKNTLTCLVLWANINFINQAIFDNCRTEYVSVEPDENSEEKKTSHTIWKTENYLYVVGRTDVQCHCDENWPKPKNSVQVGQPVEGGGPRQLKMSL